MNGANFDNLKQQITVNGYCLARVHDSANNLLWTCDANSPELLLEQIENMKPLFMAYGTVRMKLGKEKDKGNGLTWGVNWKVHFPGAMAPIQPGMQMQVHQQQQQSPFAQMLEMMKIMQLMQSMQQPVKTSGIDQDYLEKRLKLAEERHKLELEKARSSDEFDKYLPLAPIAMSAMGKSTGEIKELMQLAALGKMKSLPVNGTPSAVTSEALDTIRKMSNEDKNAAITQAWDELTTKLDAETMLLLLQTLNKKPELAQKAVQLVQNGLI